MTNIALLLLVLAAGIGTIAALHIRVGRTGNRGCASWHGGAGDTSGSAGRSTH
ncbi:hypothetical protein R1X32_03490 (plasmid) [Rhodococcus opacus]|uniref:Uncharacterized protein n=1 Tax=Rhodococcus opacus TaxID=37919 RepID=A0ABT4NL17_RHOOP|nr:hypothetical protein [Rhodococcus opacus]MCZ4588080.1 hypothetical protein [Rhodococcus opacus]NHU47694.1 hypothetical protein [Rhodococcus sp. A14]WKN60953.1 hypothetical protein HJ581_0045750 [Rhodococcus opacus]